jgi:hypothetical protein
MPGHDPVDDPATAYPHLDQLFAAYFHQDWALDGARWQDVVDVFAAESAADVVAQARAELARLAAAGFTDGELTRVLAQLGSSVDPAAWGLTPGQWLAALGARLDATGGAATRL